jgi:hypothetical protein
VACDDHSRYFCGLRLESSGLGSGLGLSCVEQVYSTIFSWMSLSSVSVHLSLLKHEVLPLTPGLYQYGFS